jgi:hypothetical protein
MAGLKLITIHLPGITMAGLCAAISFVLGDMND